jgi:hypothetical protein
MCSYTYSMTYMIHICIYILLVNTYILVLILDHNDNVIVLLAAKIEEGSKTRVKMIFHISFMSI